jgi:hypothetical protein
MELLSDKKYWTKLGTFGKWFVNITLQMPYAKLTS